MEQLTILYGPRGWALLDETLYQLAEFPTQAAAVAAAERRVRLLREPRTLVIHDGEAWVEAELSSPQMVA